MTDSTIEITEDEFAARYGLRANHLNPAASWAYGDADGCLFDTYGDELDFVRQQDPRTVWTLVDGDDGDHYVLSGFHIVNRIGYLLTTAPVPEGTTIRVRVPMPSEHTAPSTRASANKKIDIDALLAERGQIAVAWSIEDVQGVRSHLTAEQAWEVLEQVKENHDADWGICWTTLETVADDLFPEPDTTDEAEERP
jgi:hypothetical protein